MELELRSIEHGSEEYGAECELRHQVLRVPLGMSLYDEDLSAEAGQAHYGLYLNGTLLACVIAVQLSSHEVKLRQMAVSQNEQGRGRGRQLLEFLERRLIGIGYKHAVLHARVSAIGFYERLGYRVIGPEFLEVGLPHRKMAKSLNVPHVS